MYGALRTKRSFTSISLNTSRLLSVTFSAPPTESLPGKFFDVLMYQVRSYVNKQDSVSGELRRGEYLRTDVIP